VANNHIQTGVSASADDNHAVGLSSTGSTTSDAITLINNAFEAGGDDIGDFHLLVPFNKLRKVENNAFAGLSTEDLGSCLNCGGSLIIRNNNPLIAGRDVARGNINGSCGTATALTWTAATPNPCDGSGLDTAPMLECAGICTTPTSAYDFNPQALGLRRIAVPIDLDCNNVVTTSLGMSDPFDIGPLSIPTMQ